MPRTSLARAQRIVVKIGSRALAAEHDLIERVAHQIAALSVPKRSFVVVSSGAIALGCARLGYRRRPTEMAKLQAAAAAGQSVLMQRYSAALGEAGLTAAQVLLTHADLSDRERLNNARQALAALLEAKSVPIINENDTVATDEIRFGDNDQLAAMVVPLVGADLLVFLTDVDGVLDERGNRIDVMTAERRIGTVRASTEIHGVGGIESKLDAAAKACRSGAAVVVGLASQPNILVDILEGNDVGTVFLPAKGAIRARKHWIAFTLRPRGALLVDDGAAHRLREGRSSLLPVGVLGIRGQFNAGDAVQLITADGNEIARGLARLGALDVARAAGKKGRELEVTFGRSDVVVVHKDDLVVTG